MARRRRKPPDSRELTNGPGKLTNALAITGADYGRDLCGGRLYLEHSELPVGRIGRSSRINVDYAGIGHRSDGVSMNAATATFRSRRATN